MTEPVFITPRLRPFGVSVFSEMTALAMKHQAINLAQGFPDFEGPAPSARRPKRRCGPATTSMRRSMGHPLLVAGGRRQLSHELRPRFRRHDRGDGDLRRHRRRWPRLSSGCRAPATRSSCSSRSTTATRPWWPSPAPTRRCYTLPLPGLCVRRRRAGAPLHAAHAAPASSTRRTTRPARCSPLEELATIADLCTRHHVICVTDEVYEHLTFDGAEHIPMASMPGMRERTLTLSLGRQDLLLHRLEGGLGGRARHRSSRRCRPPTSS